MKVDKLRDERAEAQLIGCVLTMTDASLDAGLIGDALGALRDEDFYRASHRCMWAAIRAVHARGEHVSMITVRDELVLRDQVKRVGGDEALLGFTDVIVTDAHVQTLVQQLRRIAAVRTYQERMLELIAESQEPLEDLENFVDRVERAFSGSDARLMKRMPQPIGEIAASVYADLERRAYQGDTPGYRTGLHDYDELVGGLQPGEVTVVAARPGMGKSALAQAWARGVAHTTQKPALIVSLEMSRELLGRRLLASEGEVDGQRIRAARLNRHELDRLRDASDRLGSEMLYVEDDPTTNILDVRRMARAVAAQHSGAIGVVVIDYAQLIEPLERSQSREQDVAAISRGAVRLAKELRVPVVLLAQLNRDVEKRPNKRPMLSDLRESGALEQDANIVTFIYRDEVYNKGTEQRGIAELIVAKNRSGPTGLVEVRFVKEWTRFQNFDGRDYSRPEQQGDLYQEEHAF